MVTAHDPSKDNRTVFVSNLDYSTSSDQVHEVFSSVGTITELRLVKDFKGRSKGFCYVVFSSFVSALELCEFNTFHLCDLKVLKLLCLFPLCRMK